VNEAALKESEKLTVQHAYLKEVLGGHVVSPWLIPKLSRFEKIMDIESGNGM